MYSRSLITKRRTSNLFYETVNLVYFEYSNECFSILSLRQTIQFDIIYLGTFIEILMGRYLVFVYYFDLEYSRPLEAHSIDRRN